VANLQTKPTSSGILWVSVTLSVSPRYVSICVCVCPSLSVFKMQRQNMFAYSDQEDKHYVCDTHSFMYTHIHSHIFTHANIHTYTHTDMQIQPNVINHFNESTPTQTYAYMPIQLYAEFAPRHQRSQGNTRIPEKNGQSEANCTFACVCMCICVCKFVCIYMCETISRQHHEATPELYYMQTRRSQSKLCVCV